MTSKKILLLNKRRFLKFHWYDLLNDRKKISVLFLFWMKKDRECKSRWDRQCWQRIDCQHIVSADSGFELRHLVGADALFQNGHSKLRFTVSAGRRLRESMGMLLTCTMPIWSAQEDIFLGRPTWEWSRQDGRPLHEARESRSKNHLNKEMLSGSISLANAQDSRILIKNSLNYFAKKLNCINVSK